MWRKFCGHHFVDSRKFLNQTVEQNEEEDASEPETDESEDIASDEEENDESEDIGESSEDDSYQSDDSSDDNDSEYDTSDLDENEGNEKYEDIERTIPVLVGENHGIEDDDLDKPIWNPPKRRKVSQFRVIDDDGDQQPQQQPQLPSPAILTTKYLPPHITEITAPPLRRMVMRLWRKMKCSASIPALRTARSIYRRKYLLYNSTKKGKPSIKIKI